MITVVIPTYQERDTITDAVDRILALPIESKVIIVDDDSTDGTKDMLRQIVEQYTDRVHVVHRASPRSFGGSYIDGFALALRDPSCEAVVECDADGSHPFERIPELVRILENADMSVGSRYIEGGNIGGFSRDRLLLSSVANMYLRIATGIHVKDITAGFVAYRRSMLERLPFQHVQSNGYAFQIEMKHLVRSNGGRIVELPITFVDRSKGQSKMSFSTMVEAFILGARYLWKR